MTDRERLLQTLAATYAYYERELSEFVVQVWLEDLEAYPVEAVCAAFVAHRRDPERGQWLPKSADILRQLRGDVDDRAQVAWGKVLATAQGRGGGALDSVTMQALQAVGGMIGVRMADERQNGFLQKRFCDAYAAYARRAEAAPLGVAWEEALRLPTESRARVSEGAE